MGKLVVTEFVSVDGVFEDPGGAESYEHGGWTFEYDRGEDGGQFKLDEVIEAEVQLLGRVTYESFAAAWPSREGPFADKLNSDPKVVVSTTLENPTWENTTVISDNVVDGIRSLRDETEGAILFFEDTDAPPYFVDGQLTQLRHAGKLDAIAGVVVGDMYRCDYGDLPREVSDWRAGKSIEDVLDKHLAGLDVPVLYKLPLGHGKHLASIPLGVRVTLDADERKLTVDESPFHD